MAKRINQIFRKAIATPAPENDKITKIASSNLVN